MNLSQLLVRVKMKNEEVTEWDNQVYCHTSVNNYELGDLIIQGSNGITT